jgi:hypothetical protein
MVEGNMYRPGEERAGVEERDWRRRREANPDKGRFGRAMGRTLGSRVESAKEVASRK